MKNIFQFENDDSGINDEALHQALIQSISDKKGALKKVLLLPPDFTRFHSNAGKITNMYYHMLKETCKVDIMPTLGTHVPMTKQECEEMYGDIPFENFFEHNWRSDVVEIGSVPAAFSEEVSEGVYCEEIKVEVNKKLLDGYDLILSIGQVVPHEVVGMANYTKNILVGAGGSGLINASHIMGAFYGMERMMGKDKTPVRMVFDYCEEKFLKDLPIRYVLTVTTAPCGEIKMHGLFIGEGREPFEKAVELAQRHNLQIIDKALDKVVVFLDEQEFKSTWLGNKSIYRTRMAIADGGELIIIAPGVDKFGEDPNIDALIRKYGYLGRENIIKQCKSQKDLQENMSAAAHLIHGSSDGRFKITYCTQHLSQQEIEDVGFEFMPYSEASKIYNVNQLEIGNNTLANGDEIYFIPNPALGLWADKERF